jgi:hypothetical protein
MLSIALVDTISGRVLHAMHQSGASGPVHAAFFDNTAVVFFWEPGALRWQALTIEIYDRSHRSLSNWQIVVGARRSAVCMLRMVACMMHACVRPC